MENEELINKVQKVIEYTSKAQQETNQKSEKLQIALSNTLRLTKSNNTILSKLKGNPQDLTAYLIRLSTELNEEVQVHLHNISKSLKEIEESLQKT